MKVFPMNLSFGSPPQTRRLPNRGAELLPYVFNKCGHNAPRLRARRSRQLDQAAAYGKWNAGSDGTRFLFCGDMESKPEGQEIERFGGAVRQIQTLAFNKGAGGTCLLHQLRKDFLVEMRRVAIPSSRSQVLYLPRRRFQTSVCPGEVESGSPTRTCANTGIYGAFRSYWITQ
jgi:hypothetical protein